MKIHWSPEAVSDFTAIIQYIRQDNPSAALGVAQNIYKSIARLSTFSNLGRSGRVDETRELPLPRLPFIVVYRVKENVVEIARLLHGAQRWPPQNE
jgi:addiction module RelE/StbE family toxin